ncbi:MAG: hypothetical protein PHZ09_10020 [Eubacteriales bacterium]|nr:hypothetical protein [Eubacteriales bacterium]
MNIESLQEFAYDSEKEKQRALESKRRWARRLRSLDIEAQKKISAKYYGGAMPWIEAAK